MKIFITAETNYEPVLLEDLESKINEGLKVEDVVLLFQMEFYLEIQRPIKT